MRIVLDTNILVRANPNSNGVARILLLTILESAEHVLVLSPFLLRETERVLNYPRLQAIWPLTLWKLNNTHKRSRISRNWLALRFNEESYLTTKKMIQYWRQYWLGARRFCALWTATSITAFSSDFVGNTVFKF
jgi:hypothetical protein